MTHMHDEVITKRASGTALPRATKADGGEGAPEADAPLRALVSAYGVLDSQGEVVDKGAFSASLAERGESRPVIWSHDLWGVHALIGRTVSFEDTDEGLVALWRPLDTEAARAVVELLDNGAVTDYSFSAGVRDSRMVDNEGEDGGQTRHLTDLDLIEVGPCLRGANPEARHLGRADVEPADGGEADDPDSPDTAQASDDGAADVRKALARLALLGLLHGKDTHDDHS